jgi:phosphopantetheinyl transferase
MTPYRAQALLTRIELLALPAPTAPPVSIAERAPIVPPASIATPAPIAPPAPGTGPWVAVKVWKIVPDQIDDPLERMIAVLGRAERRRAQGKRTAQSRRAYVIAHALLREVLAAELGIDPREVPFATGRDPYGKPALTGSTQGLTFNLSHTHGLILIAVARGREVGVDVEWLGRRVRETALSRRHFTESELAELACAPRDERGRCFLQLWTRREAHVKMTGRGLWSAIDDNVDPDPSRGGAGISLCDLDLAPDHVGALAVQACS